MLTGTSSFAQFQSRRDGVADNGMGLEENAAEMVVRSASMETVMDHTAFARAARQVARQTRQRKLGRQEVAQVFPVRAGYARLWWP